MEDVLVLDPAARPVLDDRAWRDTKRSSEVCRRGRTCPERQRPLARRRALGPAPRALVPRQELQPAAAAAH